MSYVLGIDGGGTKTVCVLMNESRQILGRGEGGPSNYQSVGLETTKYSLQLAIERAIFSAQFEPGTRLEGIGLGLAGVGRPEDVNAIAGLVEELAGNQGFPLPWALKAETTVICGDSITALVGGIGQPVGIVAIAGTGSQIFGQNRHGKTKRVGGWGSLLGDEGSAYNIAIQGLQAALKAYDGRLESTGLIEAFQTHLHLKSIEDLIEVVYRRGWRATEIAALAPLVDRAAVAGDRVANRIIDNAVSELVLATQVAIAELFDTTDVFEIVTMGGTWYSAANLRGRFEEAMREIAPLAQIIWPRHEPAWGAGILALEALAKISDIESEDKADKKNQ